MEPKSTTESNSKSKYKEYVTWVRITSQLLLLVQLMGHLTGWYELTNVLREDLATAINVLLGLLSTIGILTPEPKAGRDQG